MLLLIFLALLISCELQEWRQRGAVIVRGCEPATFSISPPALQSPSAWTISRPGQRCHLLFISSAIRGGEKKYCIL